MLHLYSSSHEGQFFIGVAGWSYPQWQSLLGLDNVERNLAELARLCELFNLVEITSAYYHPPESKTIKAWLMEVPSEKPFYFTVRMWNKLVRERALLLQNDIRLMKAALAPLQEAGKLGGLLVPVLPAMRYSESNELWLLGLLDTFAEFPLYVENLHVSWSNSDTILRLQDRGVGIIEVEEAGVANRKAWPQPSSKHAAYLRCNGRTPNAARDTHADREARFDYLYSESEISNLALEVKMRRSHLSACFVVFNNYPHGNSLANALQFQHALMQVRVNPPHGLLQAFPVLQNITNAARKQSDLFEESI